MDRKFNNENYLASNLANEKKILKDLPSLVQQYASLGICLELCNKWFDGKCEDISSLLEKNEDIDWIFDRFFKRRLNLEEIQNAAKAGHAAQCFMEACPSWQDKFISVGKDVRILRDSEAEQDELLLLRQLHELRALLGACEDPVPLTVLCIPQQGWCLLGVAGSRPFMFHPWGAFTKEGAAFVRVLSSLRGLQMALLNLLKDSRQNSGGDEFLILSVVGCSDEGMLEDLQRVETALLAMRRSEKAIAIQRKREELQRLEEQQQLVGAEENPVSLKKSGSLTKKSSRQNGTKKSFRGLPMDLPKPTETKAPRSARSLHSSEGKDFTEDGFAEDGFENFEGRHSMRTAPSMPEDALPAPQLSDTSQVDLASQNAQTYYKRIGSAPKTKHGPSAQAASQMTQSQEGLAETVDGEKMLDYGARAYDMLRQRAVGENAAASTYSRGSLTKSQQHLAQTVDGEDMQQYGARAYDMMRMKAMGENSLNLDPAVSLTESQQQLAQTMDGEDMEQYGMRAYDMLRMRAVDQDVDTSMSVSLTESQQKLAQTVTGEDMQMYGLRAYDMMKQRAFDQISDDPENGSLSVELSHSNGCLPKSQRTPHTTRIPLASIREASGEFSVTDSSRGTQDFASEIMRPRIERQGSYHSKKRGSLTSLGTMNHSRNSASSSKDHSDCDEDLVLSRTRKSSPRTPRSSAQKDPSQMSFEEFMAAREKMNQSTERYLQEKMENDPYPDDQNDISDIPIQRIPQKMLEDNANHTLTNFEPIDKHKNSSSENPFLQQSSKKELKHSFGAMRFDDNEATDKLSENEWDSRKVPEETTNMHDADLEDDPSLDSTVRALGNVEKTEGRRQQDVLIQNMRTSIRQSKDTVSSWHDREEGYGSRLPDVENLDEVLGHDMSSVLRHSSQSRISVNDEEVFSDFNHNPNDIAAQGLPGSPRSPVSAQAAVKFAIRQRREAIERREQRLHQNRQRVRHDRGLEAFIHLINRQPPQTSTEGTLPLQPSAANLSETESGDGQEVPLPPAQRRDEERELFPPPSPQPLRDRRAESFRKSKNIHGSLPSEDNAELGLDLEHMPGMESAKGVPLAIPQDSVKRDMRESFSSPKSDRVRNSWVKINKEPMEQIEQPESKLSKAMMEITLGGLAGEDATLKRLDKYNALINRRREKENPNIHNDRRPTPSRPSSSNQSVSTEGSGPSRRKGEERSLKPHSAIKRNAKVFGKGSSNRKLVKNALQQVCLAGHHNIRKKNEALEALEACKNTHFIILLNQNKTLSFKGLYSLHLESGEAEKLFGIGPSILNDKYEGLAFYKYNSAGREFRELSSKSFTVTTDAVSLQGHFFSKKKNAQL